METFRLNYNVLQEELKKVPVEVADNQSELVITLPLPNGEVARFRIEESPITSPALSEQFPEIRSYRATGLDDPTALARIEYTPDGLSGFVISAAGDFYFGPTSRSDRALHGSYFKSSVKRTGAGFECFVKRKEQKENRGADRLKRDEERSAFRNLRVINDDKIRKYSLAIAVTGEYVAAVHEPNDPQNPDADLVRDAYQAIFKTVNQLNLIFESEVGVRLELIDREKELIFTNPETDPYTNNDNNNDSTKNQEVIDDIIGGEHYDIGHVFTTSSGGAARQPSVCDPDDKADAASGSANPSGHSFEIDTVAHEIGHQFGASHSFNGTTDSCGKKGGRVSHAAYEPGSGSTIMSYSGISITGGSHCGSETIQARCDNYFHANSLREITEFITGADGSCGSKVTSSNKQRPVVRGGPDFSIPKNTPFTLTAEGGEDGDKDVLTYTWEQFDLGEPDPPNPSDSLDLKKIRPIFRSRRGTLNPSRTFPALADILSNPPMGIYTAESLPVTGRTLTFRVTARDRRGRFGFDDVKVRVISSAGGKEVGPFVITQPQEGAVWERGSTQVIRWDVGRTRFSPISCTSVRILLLVSDDQGNPVVLINETDNDGEETVIIPSNITLTNKARVKIEAVGNIFFNVSAGDIQITATS